MQLFEHGVVPLLPYSDSRLHDELALPWACDCGAIADGEVDRWETSNFNVGLLCGSPTCTTVLEVTSRSAQLWLDNQNLPCTAQWLCRRSRCYLFFGDTLAQPVTELRPGLRLLSTGAHVTLPGSIYDDGRLVYWENSPDEVVIEELPSWLVPPSARMTGPPQPIATCDVPIN
jgi:hypothetical protein